MSSAWIAAFLLSLTGQVSDGRYGGAPPIGSDATDESARGASAVPPGSEFVISPETPQPTLVESAASPVSGEPDPAPPLPPAEANPLDSATPLSGGAATPPAESSVLTGGPKPADMMRDMLQTPASGQLEGRPASLGAAVGGAARRSEQTELVQAYWGLSAAVARYYVALQEAVELAALRQGVASPSAAWEAARAEFDDRIVAAREAAIAAQWRLRRLMGGSAQEPLPLPKDAPHCGRYNTRYDEIFAVRTDPAAEQLDALLPRLHAQVIAETKAAADAADWLAYVSEHRDPATDGTGLLRAYELLSLRRRAFIDAVHAYNDSIAEYAELAAPDEVAPERVVSMLIRTSTGAAMASGVQPVGAIEQPEGEVEPAGGSAATSGRGGRRTFADRIPFEARRPFSRFRNRERSIVVRRGPLQRLLDRE